MTKIFSLYFLVWVHIYDIVGELPWCVGIGPVYPRGRDRVHRERDRKLHAVTGTHMHGVGALGESAVRGVRRARGGWGPSVPRGAREHKRRPDFVECGRVGVVVLRGQCLDAITDS